MIENLACNNCGAPLSVPTTTNFATCAHCGSALAIRRTDTAHYTEVIERLEEQTERMGQELRDLRIEHELIKLDQQWEEERTEYLLSTKHGQLQEPSIWSAGAMLLLAIGSPTAVCVFMPRFGWDSSLPHVLFYMIFFVIMPALFLILAAYEYRRYKNYEDALKRYNHRRDALLNSQNEQQT